MGTNILRACMDYGEWKSRGNYSHGVFYVKMSP